MLMELKPSTNLQHVNSMARLHSATYYVSFTKDYEHGRDSAIGALPVFSAATVGDELLVSSSATLSVDMLLTGGIC